MKYIIIIFFLLQAQVICVAQVNVVSLDQALQLALERNPTVQAAAVETSRQQTLKKTAWELPKTDFSFMYGQYNSIQKKDNNLTISQSIPFPTVFTTQNALNKELIASSLLKESMTKNELMFQVKKLFNQLLFLKAHQRVLIQYDSLLTDLAKAAALQYKIGEGTLLAKTSAETQLYEMKNLISRNASDRLATLQQIQLICQSNEISDITGESENFVPQVELDSSNIKTNPTLAFASHQVDVSRQIKKVERARVFPELKVGYFNQTLIGTQNVNGQERYFGSSKRFQGFQFGITIPIWIGPYAAKIRAASKTIEIAEKQKLEYQLIVSQQYSHASQEVIKNRNSLQYYRESALETAALLAEQSRKAFKSGELDYATLLLNLRQSLSIREGYLLALQQYNQSIITIQYLNGNQ